MTTALPTRTAVIVAAAASAAAGMVHAAAAGAHADDRTLAALFAATAVLQLAWAAWVLARPGRVALAGGIALQAGAFAAWGISRTIGIESFEALAAQDVSFQDGAVAGLELVAASAAVVALATSRRPAAVWRPRVAAALTAAVIAVAAPAMAFPHTHDHGHDDGSSIDVAAGGTLGADDGHAHGDAADESEATGEAAPLQVDPRLVGAPGVDGITAEQHDRAVDLIETTNQALARYPDPAAAEAAGYRSIGDGFTGHEHFVHYGFLADSAILDPATVESLVFRVNPDGSKELVSGMYILPPGATMADVPDIAGALTTWHDHQNLCWNEDGSLAGILVDGECRPGGTFRATPPMLHVWIVEHPCGPFAGIDGTHGEGCEPDHTH